MSPFHTVIGVCALILLDAEFSIGQANTSTLSMSCEENGKPKGSAVLTCKVTAGDLKVGFYIYRPGEDQQSVVQCQLNSSSCSVNETGYTASATSSQVTLTIESFNPETDAGEWTCRDGPTGKTTGETYSTCTKSAIGAKKAVTLSMSCKDDGKPGKRTVVACGVAGDLEDSVYVYRPGKEQEFVVHCESNLDTCLQDVPGYTVDASSGQVLVTIESFNRTVDAGEWTCQYGSTGEEQSTCTKSTIDAVNIKMDCMEGGKPGRNTEVVCKVTGDIQNGIYLYRPGKKDPVVHCDYDLTSCDQDVAKYSGIPSPGQVTLTIESFNPETDAGEWMCRDGPTGEKYSTCIKSTIGPASTSMDCVEGGKPGRKTDVVCKVTGDIRNGIYFFRPGYDDHPVVHCDHDLTSCDQDVANYSGIPSPGQVTLTIESFNPETDDGEWICCDGPTGETYSMCTKSTIGPADTSMDCNEDGKPGRKTYVICKVNSDIRDGIYLYRPGNDKDPVVHCDYDLTSCDQDVANYNGIPSYRQIILSIESFNRTVDAGEWMCRDGLTGETGSTCMKRQDPARTSMDCMEVGRRGHFSTDIVCTIEGDVVDSIGIYRPTVGKEMTLVVECDRHLKKCDQHVTNYTGYLVGRSSS
ncbi:uncharacterized protein LOC121385933 [Gigantopelta aegis]|uniref:uncharacterized protein LOC121385933 n=1 Tax=Gigantopelta aegis TaxID=1735272 RepID=UPI001B888D14|nr:uncharacterized protein LOC121385933 [Gigantopelta aegis]